MWVSSSRQQRASCVSRFINTLTFLFLQIVRKGAAAKKKSEEVENMEEAEGDEVKETEKKEEGEKQQEQAAAEATTAS